MINKSYVCDCCSREATSEEAENGRWFVVRALWGDKKTWDLQIIQDRIINSAKLVAPQVGEKDEFHYCTLDCIVKDQTKRRQ